MYIQLLKHLAKLVAVGCVVITLLGGRTCFGSGHGAPKSGHGKGAKDHGGHGGQGDQGGDGSHGGHGDGHGSQGEGRPSVKSNGIELGQFKIRSDYPAEAQKSTVRFVIYAATKPELRDEMERLVEHHKTKLRDEIITATRLTPLGVFEEPDLAMFRRRILIRLRRTLPELAIESLYISDFGLIVKSL